MIVGESIQDTIYCTVNGVINPGYLRHERDYYYLGRLTQDTCDIQSHICFLGL